MKFSHNGNGTGANRLEANILILDHREGSIKNKVEDEAIAKADIVFTIQIDGTVHVHRNKPGTVGINAEFVDGLTEPEYSLQQAAIHKKAREKPVVPMNDNDRHDVLQKASAVWREV